MRIINPFEVNQFFVQAFIIAANDIDNCRRIAEGAVLVGTGGEIISKGYNQISVRNICRSGCISEAENRKICPRVHAVQMAVIKAVNDGRDLKNARLYLVERHLVEGEFAYDIPEFILCRKCNEMLLAQEIEVVLRYGLVCVAYTPQEIERYVLVHRKDELKDWKHLSVGMWKRNPG